MYRALNMRHTKEWTDGNILWEACGNFVTSCLLGYFLNVCFESPFINLERALFRRDTIKTIAKPLRQTSSNNLDCITDCSSANDSPELAKRDRLQLQSANSKSLIKQERLSQSLPHNGIISTTDSSSSHSSETTHELEAKQLKRLVNDELLALGENFNSKPKSKSKSNCLMKSKSTTIGQFEPKEDTESEEIYQLESENYHHSHGYRQQQLDLARARLGLPSTKSPVAMYNNNMRAANYATLARTSRFSQQDMSAILTNRPKSIANTKNQQYQLQQQHNRYPNQNYTPFAYNNNISNITRRKPRYNTLASARDWSHQQVSLNNHPEHGVTNLPIDTFNRPNEHSVSPQFESSMDWNLLANKQEFVDTIDLRQYMIPRVEMSCLRRPQMSRLLHPDVNRNSLPIAEEPQSLEDEVHENVASK